VNSGVTPDVAPVVVIGGGIGGLVAAYDLARAGHHPVLLEASDRFGGVLSAHQVGGLTLDAGAESFATSRPAVADLLGELDVVGRVTYPNPVGAWVRHRAGSAPLPASGFLGIPGRPWAADVRTVIGLRGVARCVLDALLPTRSGLPSGATLGGVVRSRMGHRVLDRLVEPVAGGVYAADPDILEVAAIAPGLSQALVDTGSLAGAARQLRGGGERAGSAVATLSGGLHTMVAPLVTAIRTAGGVLRPHAPVSALIRDAEAWIVRLPGEEAIRAASMVLAVPGPQAAKLLAAVPAVSSEVLLTPITPVLICTLVIDDHRLDDAPRGTGVLVSAHATGVRAKALTHATAKWPWLAEIAGSGRHVLRLSYGRTDGTDLPADGELTGIALADAAELLGVALSPGAVIDSAAVRWYSALPAPRPGHADAVRALRADLARLDASVVGAAVAGSGLAAVVSDTRQQVREMLERSDTVAGGASPSALGEGDPARG